MGVEFQVHKAAVDISKGYRQLQKADSEFHKDNVDSGVRYLDNGLGYFASALDHLTNAEVDPYIKASREIDKANVELQQSINEYREGNLNSAQRHYHEALNRYDVVLDMID